MKIKRVCKWCGKEFEVKPSKIKQGYGKFCSQKCWGKWKSENIRHKNHPSWKRVIHVCEYCGKEFEVTSYKAKIGIGKFCSRECKDKSQKSDKVKRICEICGNTFFIRLSAIKQGNGRFCSRKCSGIAKLGKNNPNWQGGISFEPYCHKFNKKFKEYIRDKFGSICFLCGKTEEENGRCLDVHHVNYNKSCGCDKDKTCQFVPLCRSCNTKVNKNREMWEAKINAMLHNKLNGWYV